MNWVDPQGLGDWPGNWDNGVVTNNTNLPITTVDVDNQNVEILLPGETTDVNVDFDFVVNQGETIKVGPNNITVENDGSITQTGIDLIPGNNPHPATPEETEAVNKILDKDKKPNACP